MNERVIKFRAWEKVSVSDDEGKTYTDDSFMVSWEDMQEEGLEDYLLRGQNLMQFTGLLDKNGKEIYEGDILYVEEPLFESEMVNALVEFKKGMFVGQIKNSWHTVQAFVEPEVIGNIYENPELTH